MLPIWSTATKGYENCPCDLGILPHMDMFLDFLMANPSDLTKNYNGEALPLGDTVWSIRKFSLSSSLGPGTLITSDGTTILGADDKLGLPRFLR